jgi:hypothetical protein
VKSAPMAGAVSTSRCRPDVKRLNAAKSGIELVADNSNGI